MVCGFGIETDIREYLGQIVISHDIADSNCRKAEELFELYNESDNDLTLAINIKSDGLQQFLKALLEKYTINNYFVFDMSIPDALCYLDCGIRIFTRQSEYEREPALYKEAVGVVMDLFETDWINSSDIQHHLDHNKAVCIISPELHGREYLPLWQKLAKTIADNPKLMLCTDYPQKAQEFFYGKA
ncbi:MAG: hypothetical protein KAV87_11250 [Desulfobacteraceae bacterium]|nr:hypothetical protein [Desulfobacteraceae bacterium]